MCIFKAEVPRFDLQAATQAHQTVRQPAGMNPASAPPKAATRTRHGGADWSCSCHAV